MLNALTSFWHEIVFWWAVGMTLVVCYDHADKVRAIFERIVIKLRREK
jgi:acetylglutamate kinase